MTDKESVITHLLIINTWAVFAREHNLQFFTTKHLDDIVSWTKDAVGLLKEYESKIDTCIICETCSHKLKDNWHWCPWCGSKTMYGRKKGHD